MNQRLYRVIRRTSIKARDISSSIEWNLLGGKRYFTRYYNELRSAHKWCFIVGVNNSGTSLLQRALEMTGQISTLPYEGQLYTTVLKRGMKKGYERVYSEYEHELIIDEDDSTEQGPRLVFDWMRCLNSPIENLIVEKTPHNALRIRWLRKIFPRSYFICLVRNGYAVSEGIRRKGNKSIERAAWHWNHANKQMLKQISGMERCMVIKYEDIVDNRADSSIRLAEFLGIETTNVKKALSDKYKFNSDESRTANQVNNMNNKSFEALSDEDKSKISEIAFEMLDHFSYKPYSE